MKRYLIAAAVLLSLAATPAFARGYSYHAPRQHSAPYAGFGKTSKVTGLPKVKTTSGYVKRNGTYVNPYARSK